MYLVKRRRVYWAIHDVPKRLQAKLGKRLAKSLKTESKAKAEQLASLLWLHDWKRRLDGQAVAAADDDEASFFRELIRDAKTDEDREALIDYVGDIATKRGEKAEDQGDYAALEAAERFAKAATGRLIPFSDHIDPWIASLQDAPKTKVMKRREVEKVAKVYPYIQEFTPNAASKWISDATAAGQLSVKTVGRLLSFLRSFWKYLKEQRVLSVDPLAGLSPPSTAKKRKGWVPFSPAQVVALKKRAADEGDAELADLIDMGMWSGARIEELCGLKVTSVDLRAKAFKVIDAKTKAGEREVPIHAKLMPTMRRLIGKRKDGFVLANLTENKFGDRSNAIGKRFGHLKRRAGFAEGHVFHSIRKTVVTLLENAGVSENIAADIVGHEKPRITYGIYSGGATLAVKRVAVAKLNYPVMR